MILLLGATGYIGQAFSAELRRRKMSFMPVTRSVIDYTRFEVLFNFVRNTRAQFIINAAGYTGRPGDADCEAHRAEAVQANTLLPQTVARVCYLTNTPWGHVSSGSIYSGAWIKEGGGERIEPDLSQPQIRALFDTEPELFRGFSETDEPNFSFRAAASTFLSGTKALAEEALQWFEQCYLWRPRMMFDQFDVPQNTLSRILASTRILDSVDSLTNRGDFVRACLDMWEHQAPYGTYNMVNPGAVSLREIAVLIGRHLDPDRRIEFFQNEAELRASGGAANSHCILDTSKLLSVGVTMPPLRQSLESSLSQWQTPPPNQEWLATSLKPPVTS